MNCRDAERLWNTLLDARDDAPTGLESRLEAHASACPACAGVAARYRTLRAAIAAWAPPPVAEAEPVVRLLRARLAEDSISVPSRRPIARPYWLAAAVVLVGSAIGLRLALVGVRPGPAPAVATAGPTLAESIVEATSATLELARETSAPAGRVGRVVLASATLATADRPPSMLGASLLPRTEVLQSVGDRVGAGVRPLSGSARRAFGFLLPTPEGNGVAEPTPSTKSL